MNFLATLWDRLQRSSDNYRPWQSASGDAWKAGAIARRQHAEFEKALADLRRGRARADFRAAADAVLASEIVNPRVVEIGCGSGYYSEIFSRLASPLRYLGVDYSVSMIRLARRSYPSAPFLVGDATALPMASSSCDIAISGNSLMHIPQYAAAISETVRVARRWCVFHSVPVTEERPTTVLQKKAYGVEVPEIVFNRRDLEHRFQEAGLGIQDVRETIPYDLQKVIGERTRLLTYRCEKLM